MSLSERRIDFKGISEALRQRGCDALIDALGASYRRSGAFLFVQPPVADGKDSFWVKPMNGTWRNEVAAKGGDLIALIAYVKRIEQIEAYRWARSYLGFGEEAHAPVSAQDLAKRDTEARQRAANEQARRDARSKRLFDWWRHLPEAKGTLVRTYLDGRGIDFERMGRFAHSLRFSACEDHVDDDGVVTTWPCMVALIMKGVDGIGVHKTYLSRDGRAKAPVMPPKKMLGQKSGGTIRLWHGRGDKAPSKATALGIKMPLIIGEGIETTLSAACAQPAYRAEAVMDLGNMLKFTWPDYASHVIWLRENDTKPQAVRTAEAVEAHLMAEAKRCGGIFKTVRSEVGSDFNDWRE